MPKFTDMYGGTVVSVPIVIDRDVDAGSFSKVPIIREKIVVLYVKITNEDGSSVNKKLYYSFKIGTEVGKARDIALSDFTTIASARIGDVVQFKLYLYRRELSNADCEIAYFKNLSLEE